MTEENQPPVHARHDTNHLHETEIIHLQEELERIQERIDQNGIRIDQISASLREFVMRPPPEVSKGLQVIVSVAITISLASLAANLTTVILLVTHILGGR